MSLSLRDQLLQAGLLSQKQAQQSKKEQHRDRQQYKKGEPPPPDLGKLMALRAAAEKAERDQELNRQRQAKAEQKARRAQIKQLVEAHRLPRLESDDLYNFVDGTHIRRLPVDAARRQQLVAGQLAIVRSDGRYEVVPAAIGRKVADIDPHSAIKTPGQAEAVDENDPYKEFVVPDDLTW